MDEDDFPTPDAAVGSIEPGALKERIDAGEQVTVLDVRAPSEFATWRVDGPSVETTNVPYYEFLDGVDDDLLSTVPRGDPLVVICAKGTSSAYVAGVLAESGRDAVNLADGMNGWAGIYEASEVTRYDGAGELYQYVRPSSGCVGYILVSGDEAAVIDPLRTFADRYREDAADRGAELTYAIDTHVHADHVSGVRALEERGAEGVVPSPAAERGVTYTDRVSLAGDGESFRVGDATIEAIHTPGHTTGMTSYLLDGSFLATGDGLFVESVARPDLEEGDDGAPEAARTLHESLAERVLALDDDVVVGGGHVSDAAVAADDGTYTATIGELEATMDALSLPEDAFVDLVLSDMPPRPSNYEEIIATNLGRRSTDDDEAFRMELGPNNCAASTESLTAD